MMSGLSGIFRWEYGVTNRHAVLVLTFTVAAGGIVIANLFNSVPFGVGLASLLAMGLLLWALGQTPQEELVTILAWCVVAWLGLTILIVALSGHVTPNQSLNAFKETHLGIALNTFQGTVMALGGVALVTATVKQLRGEKTGGSGGSTPEERVLSEEQYEESYPDWEEEGRALPQRVLLYC